MNKELLLILLLLTSVKLLPGQCSLEIRITGLKNNTGPVMLQLFDENEKVIDQAKASIKEMSTVIKFTDLRPGKYAFRFFHDENLSGIMETGRLGIPKEGYGFSNNAATPFGPKPFRDWLIEINGDTKAEVKTRY